MGKDQITLDRIKTAHPKLREELSAIYNEICTRLSTNVICRFAYVLRTFAEQDALYAKGRTVAGGKVTNAKGGQSYHNYGLAVDIVLLVDKDGNGSYETASWDTKADNDKDGISDWQEVVYVFKMYGWSWGGDWKNFPDAPHFEKSFGFTTVQLLEKYNSKKVDANNYVLI